MLVVEILLFSPLLVFLQQRVAWVLSPATVAWA
jgi:hypothetical protein